MVEAVNKPLKDGGVFTSEDATLLTSLAATAASVLKQAVMYDDAVSTAPCTTHSTVAVAVAAVMLRCALGRGVAARVAESCVLSPCVGRFVVASRLRRCCTSLS